MQGFYQQLKDEHFFKDDSLIDYCLDLKKS